jgi:hypothetical protein
MRFARGAGEIGIQAGFATKLLPPKSVPHKAIKMDINWKACARRSNSLLSFHAPPIHFMRLYVAKADAWDAFLSVSFLFAIVPIDA